MTEVSPVRLKEILFATDFSEIAAKALPYAAAIARGFDSTLCVVHVIPPEEYAHIPMAEREGAIVQLRRAAEERVTRLLTASHFRGIRHDVRLDHGEILPVLAEEVQKRGADLIVLGMHGRHGLGKAMLGSVAEEVICLAEVPVLVIGPAVTVEPEAEVAVERVMYLADFTTGSGRAQHYAEALARKWKAQLTVLYVVRDIWAEPVSTRMPGEAYLRMRLIEEGRIESIDDLQPELAVEFGVAEESIPEAAEKRQTQLLVVEVPAVGHPALASHLPGPLAYTLAAKARCPVLGIRGTVR